MRQWREITTLANSGYICDPYAAQVLAETQVDVIVQIIERWNTTTMNEHLKRAKLEMSRDVADDPIIEFPIVGDDVIQVEEGDGIIMRIPSKGNEGDDKIRILR